MNEKYFVKRLWVDFKQSNEELRDEKNRFRENFQFIIDNGGMISEQDLEWFITEVRHVDFYQARVNYIGILLQRLGESESNYISDKLLREKTKKLNL